MKTDFDMTVRTCPNGHQTASVHDFCPQCGSQLVKLTPIPEEVVRSNGAAHVQPRRPSFVSRSLAKLLGWSRTRKLIAAVIAVAVIAGAALPFVMKGGPDAKLSAALTESQKLAAPVFVSFGRIQGLADVTKAGQEAEVVARQMKDVAASIESAGGSDQRGLYLAVLNPLNDAMAELAQLATIKAETLDLWNKIEPELQAQVRAIRQAAAALVDIEGKNFDRAWVTDLANSVEALDRLMTKDQALMATWTAANNKTGADSKAALAALNTYTSAVQPLLNQYGRLRTSLGEFVDSVAAGNQTWSSAYAFLADAASQRERVKSSLEAINAPSALDGAHGTLINVIDRAVEAVKQASAGLSQCQGSYYGCYSYELTPGWQTFTSESSRISSQYSSALSAWKSTVAKEKSRFSSSATTPLPAL